MSHNNSRIVVGHLVHTFCNQVGLILVCSSVSRLDTFPGFDRSPGHGTAKGQVPGYWVPGRVQFLGPKFPRIIATILEKKGGSISMILCCSSGANCKALDDNILIAPSDLACSFFNHPSLEI